MNSDLSLDDIHMRDPFIVETSPGAFVLYGTTDDNIWGGPATGFDCYTSDDLLTWRGPHEAFRPPVGFWSESQFWAPEVHRRHDRWYMIATFLHAGTGVRGVGVLASDSPTGPFIPWSDGPVTPADTPSIDGTLFVDDADQAWLVYSRGAELIGPHDGDPSDGAMYALRLDRDLRLPIGEPALLFHASAAPWSRPLRFHAGGPSATDLGLAEDPRFTDGPFLVRSADGTLIMIWSSFSEHGYAVGQARSSSGEILGPWAQSDELVWASDGGHGMLLRTRAGEDLLVIHSPNDTPAERPMMVRVIIADGKVRAATAPRGGSDGR
ncbi:glycoside hydrolase family 43 protein [Demequina capsici]|uniref:Glycoside hydrolase family 43 protein n=1 Tax=Demequina capsici TaxID=3075620 RepID=A0AA96FBA2_9MICO|nr:glycoside hydrolase family 43 protein [Demequina sp. PMTSA13]WNM26543.1 glycoside hydrolase family 43 protein [Demequina sp. PMTSA13]